MVLFNLLVGFFTNIIITLGYAGVFVLMAMESMILPVPSELVMPFAGYAVALGKMDFWAVLIVASLGTLLGSGISYWIGAKLGRPFLEKHGKYFLISHHHLALTERWFKKRGSATILISRFIPVVRHLISIPAGMARMDLKKFFLYTCIGGTLWNAFLLSMGVLLEKNWTAISRYTLVLDILILVAVIAFLAYFVWHFRKARKQRA